MHETDYSRCDFVARNTRFMVTERKDTVKESVSHWWQQLGPPNETDYSRCNFMARDTPFIVTERKGTVKQYLYTVCVWRLVFHWWQLSLPYWQKQNKNKQKINNTITHQTNTNTTGEYSRPLAAKVEMSVALNSLSTAISCNNSSFKTTLSFNNNSLKTPESCENSSLKTTLSCSNNSLRTSESCNNSSLKTSVSCNNSSLKTTANCGSRKRLLQIYNIRMLLRYCQAKWFVHIWLYLINFHCCKYFLSVCISQAHA